MNPPAEIHNLVAYLLQGTLLALIGALLPRALRIRSPKVLLPYWQFLLVFCLVFPVLAPRTPLPAQADAVAGGPTAFPGGNAALVQEQVRPPVADWSAISWQALMLLLVTGWVVQGGSLAAGLRKLGLLRRNSRRFAALPPQIAQLSSLVGGNTEILISPDLSNPATYGWIRTWILLPEHFEKLESGVQVSILCHELIHVRRRDWLFAFGERLILALFWFHPAAWWLIRRIELAREQLVDRAVLAFSIDRRQYLRSLLSMVDHRAALISASLFLARHHLKERVALLLEEIHMSRMRLVTFVVSVMAFLGTGALVAVLAFPLGSAVSEQSHPATGFPVPAPAVLPPPAPASAPGNASAAIAAPTPAASPMAPGLPAPKPVVSSGQAKVVPVAPKRAAEPTASPVGRSPVNGMVVDRDGVPVADAAVKIADPETKATLITGVTDERGSFSLTLSPRESVEVLVSHDGFKPAVISGVKLPDGVPVNVRVALQPAGGSATVTIHAGGQATATQTNRPTGGRAIPASVISRVDPGYPAAAMQQGIEAVVMVETRVDADGNVSELRIIKGHPMFDEAAMNAVRQWRFRPAQLNGQPRQGSVTVTFVFRI